MQSGIGSYYSSKPTYISYENLCDRLVQVCGNTAMATINYLINSFLQNIFSVQQKK